jgi:hypothetical protein
MKFTIIGLTVLAILVTPYVYFGNDSSETEAWKSSVTTNFTGEIGSNPSYDFRSYGVGWFDAIDTLIEETGKTITNVSNYFQGLIRFFNGTPIESPTNPSGDFSDEFGDTRQFYLESLIMNGAEFYDIYLELTTLEKEWVLDNQATTEQREINLFYTTRWYILFIDPVDGTWYWFYDSPSVYDWIVRLE